MNDIIDDIENNADEIEKQAQIEEARKAQEERLKASLERGVAQEEREEAAAWRRECQESKQGREMIIRTLTVDSNFCRFKPTIMPKLASGLRARTSRHPISIA